MDKEDWNLRGGALIIGSLLWQNHLKKVTENIRKEWRGNQLIEKEKFLVKVPIRYGRLSDVRNSEGELIGKKSYTMVFSKNYADEKKMGNAYVLPIINTINNWSDLKTEVEAFSKAEGPGCKFVKGSKKQWCTMAIVFNPKINEEVKSEIIKLWCKKLEEDAPNYSFEDYQFGSEKSILNKDGMINIDWLEVTNKVDEKLLDELDFVICSATKQYNEINRYPTTEEIAQKEKEESIRNYFKNNIENGITTIDDGEIIKHLI